MYQIEKKEKNTISLLLYDSCNFFENPHSSKLNQNQENLVTTQKLYENILTDIKIVTSKYEEGCYFVVMNNLQYVYERNFLKRDVIFLKNIYIYKFHNFLHR